MSGQPTKRALVTGASGFIGSRLVRHLLDGGWEVGALGRRDSLANLPAGVERLAYSGATAEAMEAVAGFKPDAVFHLASLFLVDHTPDQVSDLIASNVLLGTQLLEAMRATGCTVLVNAGTAWQNFQEREPFSGPGYRPVNLYAATKQAFGDILAYYVETGGLRAVTLKLYDTYGAGDRRRKLVRVLLDAARTGAKLEMSAGEQVIDLVHVDDACRAFVQAAGLAGKMKSAGAAEYAVSGGQRRTLREVVATVEEAAGVKLQVEFGARPYREREVMHPWEGPGLPGWRPETGLLDGLRGMITEESVTGGV